MAGNENQKIKLLRLMEILNKKTDENHTLTIKDIINELSEYHISAERKSLYNDIALLEDTYENIGCHRNKAFGYYINKRTFELPELKLLVDAVQSSRFITKEKSDKLIESIKSLTSEHLAKELQRQVFMHDRVKTINEEIYDNVDKLHNAIIQNKQVEFKYFEYTVEKKRQLRNNGNKYTVSPYALCWTNDNYYLVSHYFKYNEQITHFRVDRMADIMIIEEKRKNIKDVNGDNEFDIGKYSKHIFCMFSGKSEKVQLRFNNKLINTVIDRFGEDVSLYKSDENHFIVNVEVAISNAFMTWLFQFGDNVKILFPNHLADKMKEMAKKVLDLYQ